MSLWLKLPLFQAGEHHSRREAILDLCVQVCDDNYLQTGALKESCLSFLSALWVLCCTGPEEKSLSQMRVQGARDLHVALIKDCVRGRGFGGLSTAVGDRSPRVLSLPSMEKLREWLPQSLLDWARRGECNSTDPGGVIMTGYCHLR